MKLVKQILQKIFLLVLFISIEVFSQTDTIPRPAPYNGTIFYTWQLGKTGLNKWIKFWADTSDLDTAGLAKIKAIRKFGLLLDTIQIYPPSIDTLVSSAGGWTLSGTTPAKIYQDYGKKVHVRSIAGDTVGTSLFNVYGSSYFKENVTMDDSVLFNKTIYFGGGGVFVLPLGNPQDSEGELFYNSYRTKYWDGSVVQTLANKSDTTSLLATRYWVNQTFEPTLTKGNLTETVTGLQFDNTRQVIGGAATLSLTSGYVIPTTTQETNWNTAYTNSHTHSNKAKLDSLNAPALRLNNIGNASNANGMLKNDGFGAIIWQALNSTEVTNALGFTPATNVHIQAEAYGGFGSNVSGISAGLLKKTGANTYTSITDNSSNWNTAYGWGNHASAGYAVLTGANTFTTNGITIGSSATFILGTTSVSALKGGLWHDNGATAKLIYSTNSVGGTNTVASENWSTTTFPLKDGTGATGSWNITSTYASYIGSTPLNPSAWTYNGASQTWMQYASTNTASTLVSRDASGNFSAGTITAALNGNASTVTNGVYTNTNNTLSGNNTLTGNNYFYRNILNPSISDTLVKFYLKTTSSVQTDNKRLIGNWIYVNRDSTQRYENNYGTYSEVYGNSYSSNYGHYSYVESRGTTPSPSYGVYGWARSKATTTAYGIYGKATGGGTNWAGYFDGNVYMSSLGTSGTYIPNGYLTSLTVTNTITGSVSGNAGTVTNGVYTNTNNSLSGNNTFTGAIYFDNEIELTPTSDANQSISGKNTLIIYINDVPYTTTLTNATDGQLLWVSNDKDSIDYCVVTPVRNGVNSTLTLTAGKSALLRYRSSETTWYATGY